MRITKHRSSFSRLILLMVLGMGMHEVSESRRIRIESFSIVLAPTTPEFSFAEANQVRDIADDLFESYMANYLWPDNLVYDYAGLTGVSSTNSIGTEETEILFNGGLVVFQTESSSLPTQGEVLELLTDSLRPEVFTAALQATGTFSYVETTSLKTRSTAKPPTEPPSEAPSLLPSVSPSDSPSQTPSESPSLATSGSPSIGPSVILSLTPSISLLPSFGLEVSNAAKQPPLAGPDTSSSSPNTTIMAGSIAGSVGLVIIIAFVLLLVVRRNKKRGDAWKATGTLKHFPFDNEDELELGMGGLHKRDSLNNLAVETRSEASSGILGRLLAAASPRTDDSPDTTLSAKSDEEVSVQDEEDAEAAATTATTLGPPMLVQPLHLHRETEETKQEVEESDGNLSNWTTAASQKNQLPLAAAAAAAAPSRKNKKLVIDRWSDCTPDRQTYESDNDGFAVGADDWDFHDNEDESDSGTDPFTVPVYGPRNDNESLLRKYLERSSARALSPVSAGHSARAGESPTES